MYLFSKKETLIQNITFMAIMAAINIVISVISTLMGAVVPIVSVFFIIILPLTSTVVTLFCKNRYYPIYAVATIGLSMVATMWNMEYTIFYVVPSIITGFIFGLLSKKKVNGIYSIAIAAFLQTGITYALIPLLNVIYGTNFIETAKALFNVGPESYVNYFIPTIIFAISLIQVGLSYIVIANEIRKMNIEPAQNIKNNWVLPLISVGFLFIALGFTFRYLSGAFVTIFISLYFTVASLVVFIKSKLIPSLIVLGGSVILSIILFAVFYPLINEPTSFVLIGLFPLTNNISTIIVSFLIKK